MKNKKKKMSLKKILLIVIPLLVIIIGIIIGLGIKNNNDANGVFSILENRWIENNKNSVIDVSIVNDLPIFGNEGDGVFFDFLNDFEKDTSLKFNRVPYSVDKSVSDKGYKFAVNNNTVLKDNEL